MMEGSVAFHYAAIGVTLLAIVGYLLLVNVRLTALRRERDALEHEGGWRDEADDAERGRPS